jgi:outer membrane receptor protein involved in Fe transport
MIRASFNRAFRSPSVVNNSLLIRRIFPLDLRALGLAQPFPLVTELRGNDDLKEESVSAFELSYAGRFGRTRVGVAAYVNNLYDNIRFVTEPPSREPYTSDNPPPGWPFPPVVLDILAGSSIFLPRFGAGYEQLGSVRNKGLEVSVERGFGESVSAFANASWQADPKPFGPKSYPAEEIVAPPRGRYNAGVSLGHGRWFGSLSVNNSDRAFWADVLTPEFWGWTDAYTMLNGTVGVRWSPRVTLTFKGTNLANTAIQQHVFGDILKRTVVFELRSMF